MRKWNIRNNVIIGLCLILFLMALAYAAFSSNLRITGFSNITSNFKILITDIESNNDGTGAEDEEGSPTFTSDTATFKTFLTAPGDEMIYSNH